MKRERLSRKSQSRDDQCGNSENQPQSWRSGLCWCRQWSCNKGDLSGDSSLQLEQNCERLIFSAFGCVQNTDATSSGRQGWQIQRAHSSGCNIAQVLRRNISCQYAALSKCVRHSISREEGLAALWKGHLPAQVLSVTYGFVRCQLLAPFCTTNHISSQLCCL